MVDVLAVWGARPEPLAAAGRRRGQGTGRTAAATGAAAGSGLGRGPATGHRDRGVAESFASGIRFTIARLRQLAERGAANLEVACYDRLPVWRLIGIDSTLYVGTFVEAREGHQSPLYKLTASPVGMLQCGLRWTLEDLRKHAKRIIWIIICG